jgi:hypothetical protein
VGHAIFTINMGKKDDEKDSKMVNIRVIILK